MLTRLGVTYGVLRRLGYSEETVMRCLEFIDGVDLEEAHEWVCEFAAIKVLNYNVRVPAQLFLNCTNDELRPHTCKLALHYSNPCTRS